MSLSLVIQKPIVEIVADSRRKSSSSKCFDCIQCIVDFGWKQPWNLFCVELWNRPGSGFAYALHYPSRLHDLQDISLRHRVEAHKIYLLKCLLSPDVKYPLRPPPETSHYHDRSFGADILRLLRRIARFVSGMSAENPYFSPRLCVATNAGFGIVHSQPTRPTW
jgi:hypothetical protein